jgi:hypothetical protein
MTKKHFAIASPFKGDLMRSRNLFASILIACVSTIGLGGLVPVANAASAGQPFLKFGESARNDVIEIRDRGRSAWPNLPIAPSYRAYDWPYYFRRGHYPTHIGPGYVYYGYPYTYRSGRCSYFPAKSLRRAWMDARRCVGN